MSYFKSTFTYMGVAIFSGLLSFLILPVLTKYLNPAEYGSLEIYRSFIALFVGTLLVGSNTLLFGNYYKWDKIKTNNFIHNSVFVSLLFVAIILGIYFLFPTLQNLIFEKFSIPKAFIILGLITALFQAITTLNNALFQIQDKPFLFGIFVGGYSLLSVLISLFLIIYWGAGWEGMAYGIFIASFVFSIGSIYQFFKRGVKIKSPLTSVKTIVILGSPLILTHIGGWVNEAVDKAMVASIINVSAAGIYSLGYRFGMVVMLIQVAALRAWAPFFYKKIQSTDRNIKIEIVKKSYLLIFGLFFIAIIVSIGSPIIINRFMDHSFINATHVVMLICFSYVFDGVWKVFGAYLINLNLTKSYALILVISAVVNLLANYYLIKAYGIRGSALATFISFLLGAIMTMILANFYSPMPWLYFLKGKNSKY